MKTALYSLYIFILIPSMTLHITKTESWEKNE